MNACQEVTPDMLAMLKLYDSNTYGIALGEIGREMAKMGLVEWVPGNQWSGTIYAITEDGKSLVADLRELEAEAQP